MNYIPYFKFNWIIKNLHSKLSRPSALPVHARDTAAPLLFKTFPACLLNKEFILITHKALHNHTLLCMEWHWPVLIAGVECDWKCSGLWHNWPAGGSRCLCLAMTLSPIAWMGNICCEYSAIPSHMYCRWPSFPLCSEDVPLSLSHLLDIICSTAT